MTQKFLRKMSEILMIEIKNKIISTISSRI